MGTGGKEQVLKTFWGLGQNFRTSTARSSLQCSEIESKPGSGHGSSGKPLGKARGWDLSFWQGQLQEKPATQSWCAELVRAPWVNPAVLGT